MYLVNLRMPCLLLATIEVVIIPPTNAHNLVMKRSVRRLEKLVGRPPVMVVVDEEVVAVVAVEMAVVVAANSKVVGVVLVTQQRM